MKSQTSSLSTWRKRRNTEQSEVKSLSTESSRGWRRMKKKTSVPHKLAVSDEHTDTNLSTKVHQEDSVFPISDKSLNDPSEGEESEIVETSLNNLSNGQYPSTDSNNSSRRHPSSRRRVSVRSHPSSRNHSMSRRQSIWRTRSIRPCDSSPQSLVQDNHQLVRVRQDHSVPSSLVDSYRMYMEKLVDCLLNHNNWWNHVFHTTLLLHGWAVLFCVLVLPFWLSLYRVLIKPVLAVTWVFLEPYLLQAKIEWLRIQAGMDRGKVTFVLAIALVNIRRREQLAHYAHTYCEKMVHRGDRQH